MQNCCVIGTGKRFNYFYPIFKYLINQKKITINGISNRSGIFNDNCKQLTSNLFNNYELMIKKLNPDIVFILVSANQNFPLTQKILNNYNCKIFVETPLYGLNMNNLKNKNRIHVLENWIYLPLELLKKEIVNSKILGRIKEIINDHRTYAYHGVAQIRNYQDTGVYKNIKKNNNELIFYENNTILVHRNPKIRNKRILINAENFNIISECIVEKEKKDILKVFSNNEIYNPTFEFEDNLLKSIKIKIKSNEFIWNNEFDVNLDQYQYGSLKSIMEALKNNFYTIEKHIFDLI